MFLLFYSDDHIACFVIRLLVCLALKSLLVVVGYSLVEVYFQGLFLANDLLGAALLALLPVGDDSALTLTFVTVACGLCLHAWPELDHPRDLPLTLALGACRGAFTPFAVAVTTEFVPLNAQLLCFSCLNLFQGNLHFLPVVLGLLLLVTCLSPRSPIEQIEDIPHASTATASMSTHYCFFSPHILEFAFFGV